MNTPNTQARENNNVQTNERPRSLLCEPDAFLYKYRWWIVLLLAFLLMYYLHNRNCEDTGYVLNGMQMGGAPPDTPIYNYKGINKYMDTDTRALFGL